MESTTANNPVKVITVGEETKARFDEYASKYGWRRNFDRAVSVLLDGWDLLDSQDRYRALGQSDQISVKTNQDDEDRPREQCA